MATFLAFLFVSCASFAVALANYWYTFGLWPISWMSFWLCWLASLLLGLATRSLIDGGKK